MGELNTTTLHPFFWTTVIGPWHTEDTVQMLLLVDSEVGVISKYITNLCTVFPLSSRNTNLRSATGSNNKLAVSRSNNLARRTQLVYFRFLLNTRHWLACIFPKSRQNDNDTFMRLTMQGLRADAHSLSKHFGNELHGFNAHRWRV